MIVFFLKEDTVEILLFFYADSYLNWVIILADSGTDFFFRLVALWISLVVIVD